MITVEKIFKKNKIQITMLKFQIKLTHFRLEGLYKMKDYIKYKSDKILH